MVMTSAMLVAILLPLSVDSYSSGNSKRGKGPLAESAQRKSRDCF